MVRPDREAQGRAHLQVRLRRAAGWRTAQLTGRPLPSAVSGSVGQHPCCCVCPSLQLASGVLGRDLLSPPRVCVVPLLEYLNREG